MNLFATPNTMDSLPARHGEAYEKVRNAGGRKNRKSSGNLREQVIHILPTPNTLDSLPARDGEAKQRQLMRGGDSYKRSMTGNLREDILHLLPTTAMRDYKDGTAEHKRDGVVQTDTVARAILNSGEVTLMPTTTASDWKGANHSGSGSASSRGISTTVEQTNWGKFEPAILRWEAISGMTAPAPTKPDGKDGNHRLNPQFTEWMMGIPRGWITDVGLTRQDELKMCGNGVVPQQAALALTILLEGVDFA